jgi:crotonobetainyl-CoA:carnitine CoA-transferase CaiB-like acyl-CoA transferase
MTEKPLDAIRVVDLTHVLAGPYCTYQLGLLGAEVIKVESLRGDMVRAWGGSDEQLAQGLGTGFVAQNAGKRSISVDITRPQGAEIVLALAERADIFVENYRPGALAHYGLDYDSVRERKGDLIYVSISAFGKTGPHGHRPGFDDVVQATSGFMSINVRGDGAIRTGGPVLDYASGMHATAAILAALLLRQKTGVGQRVDLAMQDVTMLLINRNTTITANTGDPPPPAGDREGPMLGRFRAKDGYVMLAGYLPRHCRAICKAIGLQQFAGLGGQEFAERGAEIERAVEQRLAERNVEEWDAIFSETGVVAGGVRDLAEVLATGQPDSRDLLTDVDSAAGTFRVTTNGYRINERVFGPASGVPRLGEHTREVLVELGYEQGEIESLVKDSVVASS